MWRWFTGLFLLAYVASYFATGLFVLCVHRDGMEFLEPVTDRCCDTKATAEVGAPSLSGLLPEEGGIVVSADSCPDCDDYAILHLAVCQSSQAEDAAPSFEDSPLPIPYLAIRTHELNEEWGRASLTGSPLPRGSPPFCRAIVLRI